MKLVESSFHDLVRLQDVFRNRAKDAFESEALAADGIILDLAYSESR